MFDIQHVYIIHTMYIVTQMEVTNQSTYLCYLSCVWNLASLAVKIFIVNLCSSLLWYMEATCDNFIGADACNRGWYLWTEATMFLLCLSIGDLLWVSTCFEIFFLKFVFSHVIWSLSQPRVGITWCDLFADEKWLPCFEYDYQYISHWCVGKPLYLCIR